MKKNKNRKQISNTFFDDTFSYFNFESSDSEAFFEEEEEMNQLLEDYKIADLDLSEIDDNSPEDVLLI